MLASNEKHENTPHSKASSEYKRDGHAFLGANDCSAQY